jgi:uncharacterized protein with GYD domain
MAIYVMVGEYSLDAVEKISAERTDRTEALLKKHGGKLKAGYATLGQSDLVLIVDLPDNETAMQVSVELTKMTGIGFTTSPAVSIKEFDQMMEGK